MFGSSPWFPEDTFIIAHRGGVWPGLEENSSAGFAESEKRGVAIETDIRSSLDNQLFLSHDPELPGGDELIRKMTSFDIQDRCYLESAEALLELDSSVVVNIDIKRGTDIKAVETFVDSFSPDRLLISSFDPKILQTIYFSRPELKRSLLLGENWRPRSVLRGAAPFQTAKRAKADFISPNISFERTGLFSRAAIIGYPVIPWTANHVDTITRYLRDINVPAIMTDYPVVALEAKERLTNM